jgi:hypothetical protein
MNNWFPCLGKIGADVGVGDIGTSVHPVIVIIWQVYAFFY